MSCPRDPKEGKAQRTKVCRPISGGVSCRYISSIVFFRLYVYNGSRCPRVLYNLLVFMVC